MAADRRNARASSSAAVTASSSGFSRSIPRSYEDHRRSRLGFRYSNFFSPGLYCGPYATYGYPSIYVQQSYGYPYLSGYLTDVDDPVYYDAETSAPAAADPGVADSATQQQSLPPAAPGTRSAQPQGEPDSLVQDVQKELTNRGYFTGKANGLVSDGFWEALRRFQTDQRLTATGLLNQATLYALGLN